MLSADFPTLTSSKHSFRYTIIASNKLDPEQDQVNPDGVQILRAKVTSRLHAPQAINNLFLMIIISLTILFTEKYVKKVRHVMSNNETFL